MIHFFDHRYGTYLGQTVAQANMGTLPRLTPAQRDDPDFVIQPRYWVQEFDTLDKQRSKPDKPVYHLGVDSRLESRRWDKDWLLGWRRICRSTDERTLIHSILPATACGDSLFLAFSTGAAGSVISISAALSSFVLDYVVRQKIAGTNADFHAGGSAQSSCEFVADGVPVPPGDGGVCG